jgi:hypothetical protein
VAALGLVLGATLFAGGCASRAGGLPLSAAATPDARPVTAPGPLGLPALPADAALAGRQLSSIGSYDGVSRYTDSLTGISPNPNNNQWLVMDGSLSAPAAWAIWRFPVSPDGPFQSFQLNVKPGSHYYLLYGNYARQRWSFFDLAAHPDGQTGSISLNPALLPGGETVLHSPGGFAYFAVLAIGQEVQVKGFDVTTPTPDPPPGTNAIEDQFEDNDSLGDCWPLTPGLYHASIHQSAAQMADVNETRDAIDCYCVDVPAGQTLTLTLRHEAFDHFGSGLVSDCDILFYTDPAASSVYNDFNEDASSTGIYYDPFEQVNWLNDTGADQTMKFAITGDISEPGVRNNDEYDLGVYVGASVYHVSGTITAEGHALDADVVAFLEPGNFNANTPVPGEGTPGIFSIVGVPPGTYTLRVHSSARLSAAGYEWPEYLDGIAVTVNEVSGLTLDVGPGPQ